MVPRIGVKAPVSMMNFFFGRKYQSKENQFLLNHARTGVYVTLKALQLPSKTKVGVMLYNCDSVVSAINKAGCEPVFLDVTDELRIDENDLRRKSTGLSVVVISHLFGIPNDISSIRKQYPQLIIIEDCAHAWGSRFADGCLCGTKGDFAVYSVGIGKLPSLGDGGLLCVNNQYYLASLQEKVVQLPTYTILQNVKLYVTILMKHLLYSPCIWTWIVRWKSKRQANNSNWHAKRMANGVERMLGACSGMMDKKIEKRRSVMKNICECLSGMPVFKQLEKEPWKQSNAFMLPLWTADKNDAIEFFRRNGIETKTHFENALQWGSQYGYKSGDCPNTEKLLQHLIMLPCYKKYNIVKK